MITGVSTNLTSQDHLSVTAVLGTTLAGTAKRAPSSMAPSVAVGARTATSLGRGESLPSAALEEPQGASMKGPSYSELTPVRWCLWSAARCDLRP
jgi:hypothetical protein